MIKLHFYLIKRTEEPRENIVRPIHFEDETLSSCLIHSDEVRNL